MFNPIILSQDESFLEWLNPEFIDIEEVNEQKQLRTVSVSYPIIEDIDHTKKLFRIGNKLLIPATAGLKTCLYVISSECKQDYFDENKVSFDAESVLVELNFVELWEQEPTKSIRINKANLERWFGMYFHIDIFEEPLNSSDRSIENNGTMTKLEWLRYIEDQTGNIFIDKYELDENINTVIRKLDFVTPLNAGTSHRNNIIDLGYNAENIVYEVDESDTYRAIAPIFSLGEEDGNTITGTTVTRSELQTVINNWKNHAVTKGSQVPMILYKNEDGSVSEYSSSGSAVKWTAPFTKNSGELFIRDDVDTGAEWNVIRPRPDYKGTKVDIPKVGTIETSETDPRIIFNNCCTTLLEKRYPTINVEVDLKDLQLLMGTSEGFDVYDTLKIKVPGLTDLIECMVCKTVKNPHTPGENSISLSSINLASRVNQLSTAFSNLVTSVKKGGVFSGKLATDEGVSLGGQWVSITIVKPESKKVVTEVTKTPVTTKVKTPVKTSSGNTNTITITDCKPSCAYNCGSYKKKYTKTYVNKCPFCGGKLKINPKGVPEKELTCSKCSADFCGVCGREKRVPFRKRLTAANAATTETKTTTKTTYKTNSTSKTVVDPGWTKVYTKKTNNEGIFSLGINLAKGTYKVTVSFGGSIEYGMCSRTVSLVVV